MAPELEWSGYHKGGPACAVWLGEADAASTALGLPGGVPGCCGPTLGQKAHLSGLCKPLPVLAPCWCKNILFPSAWSLKKVRFL